MRTAPGKQIVWHMLVSQWLSWLGDTVVEVVDSMGCPPNQIHWSINILPATVAAFIALPLEIEQPRSHASSHDVHLRLHSDLTFTLLIPSTGASTNLHLHVDVTLQHHDVSNSKLINIPPAIPAAP